MAGKQGLRGRRIDLVMIWRQEGRWSLLGRQTGEPGNSARWTMIGSGRSRELSDKLRARPSRICISVILCARMHLEVNIQLPSSQPWQTSNSASNS
jgi:hypothetical protein